MYGLVVPSSDTTRRVKGISSNRIGIDSKSLARCSLGVC